MVIMSWPMAGPGCLKSCWPLTMNSSGVSVGFRDNCSVGSSGIFICHIMFQFRWDCLICPSERVDWFIWPTRGPCLPNVQCVQWQPGPGSSRWLSHWILSVQRRVSDCHVVMSSCHNDNMTASWPTCHASDGPEIGSDCEQICRVMTRLRWVHVAKNITSVSQWTWRYCKAWNRVSTYLL